MYTLALDPLKRYLQKHVETLVARGIIKGDIEEGMVLRIDVIEDRFSIL
jgi:ATP-dependent Clp protease ATP-binding subunit ClpB